MARCQKLVEMKNWNNWFVLRDLLILTLYFIARMKNRIVVFVPLLVSPKVILHVLLRSDNQVSLSSFMIK
ncbi:hypothetical protein VNO80_20819 [Phaseolus coccineus]|uniref:Uncharacterized protein n=1 Tax=Phaseolus coccineus TaxID=3886 RepID=A0AAN9M6D5_PHACN